jgi:Flp pilus assembly pilin Flp
VAEGGLKVRSNEEAVRMQKITNLILQLKTWTSVQMNTRGQDLIEYALMAGFVAVAAGAIMPGVATNISVIFSKVASCMTRSSTQGS